MPCDSVILMRVQIQEEQREQDIATVLDILGPTVTSHKKVKGVHIISASIPMADGSQMPVNVSIKIDGKMTMGTREGTREMGVDILRLWLESAKALGVKFGGATFEKHTHHDGVAPQLAYTQGIKQ